MKDLEGVQLAVGGGDVGGLPRLELLLDAGHVALDPRRLLREGHMRAVSQLADQSFGRSVDQFDGHSVGRLIGWPGDH